MQLCNQVHWNVFIKRDKLYKGQWFYNNEQTNLQEKNKQVH